MDTLQDLNKSDLYHLLIEECPDGIIFTDREGLIVVWNKAAQDLFGYSQQDAAGNGLDIIIPEHLRAAHWNGFHKAISCGHTEHGSRALKTRATQKNGKKLYCTLAFSIVKNEAGMVIGAMATAREFSPDPA